MGAAGGAGPASSNGRNGTTMTASRPPSTCASTHAAGGGGGRRRLARRRRRRRSGRDTCRACGATHCVNGRVAEAQGWPSCVSLDRIMAPRHQGARRDYGSRGGSRAAHAPREWPRRCPKSPRRWASRMPSKRAPAREGKGLQKLLPCSHREGDEPRAAGRLRGASESERPAKQVSERVRTPDAPGRCAHAKIR